LHDLDSDPWQASDAGHAHYRRRRVVWEKSFKLPDPESVQCALKIRQRRLAVLQALRHGSRGAESSKRECIDLPAELMPGCASIADRAQAGVTIVRISGLE